MSNRGYKTYYEPKNSGGSKGSNKSYGQSQYNKGYDRDYDDYGYERDSRQDYDRGSKYTPKETTYTQKETTYHTPKETTYHTPQTQTTYTPKEVTYHTPKETTYHTKETIYHTQETTYHTPQTQTTYTPKETTYYAKETSYNQPQKNYTQKETSYNQPQKNYNQREAPKQSKYSQKETSYHTKSKETSYNTPYQKETSYNAPYQKEASYNTPQQKETSYYTPQQTQNKGASSSQSYQNYPKKEKKDDFPTLGGGDPSFPSLGTQPIPVVTPEMSQASEWGHNLKKKIQPKSTPFVPEETTKKQAAKPQEDFPAFPSSTSTTKVTPKQEEKAPQVEQPQETSKAKKWEKKKQQKPKEPEDVPQKKGKDTTPSVFQQMVQNLNAAPSGGRSYQPKEETKTNYEVADEGGKDYYAEYDKYMKEDYNNEENFDYGEVEGGDDEDLEDYDAGYNDYYQSYSGSGKGGGGLVLMVAEKPSIAKSITEALSGGKSKMRKGRSKFCPVYEFPGNIFGNSAYFKVTSVAGHVFNCDFPRQYQDWQKIDPAKLFEVETVKKEANPASRLIQHLQTEAKKASYLVLWLDNDKEGENICFEVLDIVKGYMKKENFQQVYRAKFSSIVKQDLQEAFRNIRNEPNKDESMSVDARQVIDLKVGVAFSRFQTMYFTAKYPNLNTKLVSYGPCQTPTLGFCVKRDDEIKNFKPKTFYRVVPTIALPNGGTSELTWSGERTFNQQDAHKIKADLDKSKEVVVVDVSTKEGVKGRPEALNTVQLLRVASAQLGIGPQQAMHIAERLYLSGYMTYPRTESTSYPGKYDFRGIVSALSGIFREYGTKLLDGEMKNPRGGKDVGDHPPITPTNKTPSREHLSNDEWRVYEYVSRHFLATVSADAKLTKRSVTFTCGEHEFTLNGSTTKSAGWTEIMPWIKLNDNLVPEFKINQTCLISINEVRTGQTTAPDHLTESELITLMEQHGIGTDASMATHINNICERNYVKVGGNNRKLIPTDLGISLVHGYELIDPELVAPNLRANIERSVDMIAKGKAKYDQVLKEMIAIFVQKFTYFKEHITKMDVIFGGSFGTVEENLAQGKLFSKCGKCNRIMKYADKMNKLHCEMCKVTYDLPTGGSFKLEVNKKCPLDGFGLLIFSILGSQAARYYVCPHCYNNTPYPDVADHLTCNVCPNEDCQYSVPHHELKDCDVCKEGALVIDQQAGTKHTATCNSCGCEVLIADNATSVVRDKKECENCYSYLFKTIQFKASTPGFSQLKYENVCIFCHKEFKEISKVKMPVNPNPRRGGRGRGRRGRGRGRGRGGRGGRGGKKFEERDWRDI